MVLAYEASKAQTESLFRASMDKLKPQYYYHVPIASTYAMQVGVVSNILMKTEDPLLLLESV